jgi:hypothetical protein
VPTFESMRDGIMALVAQRKVREALAALREKSKIETVDSATKP